MKPQTKLASATTPDGGRMELYRHDRDFFIKINGHDLMHSRRHESELELARLGCRHLAEGKNRRVLIGGLGMGYTLRQTLDLLEPDATIVVAELMAAVADWNREFIGALNRHPLADPRVELKIDDIVNILSQEKNSFDAILLDIDNGPEALTYGGNNRLYGYKGIIACSQALGKSGCLAVWSSGPNKDFEESLTSCGFHVRRFRVPAHKGNKAQSRFIFVAARDKDVLPPGGSAPRQAANKNPAGKRKRKH